MQNQRANISGYTLVELLVVVGLISVLTVAIGIGFSGNNVATQLASSRALLLSRMAQARALSITQKCLSAVVVAADESAPKSYLNSAAIARTSSDGNWVMVEDATPLSAGEIRILLPSAGSNLLEGPFELEIEPGAGAIKCYLISIRADGTMGRDGGGAVVLGQVAIGRDGIQVVSDGVRESIVISRYGALVENPPSEG